VISMVRRDPARLDLSPTWSDLAVGTMLAPAEISALDDFATDLQCVAFCC
jgi:hypothetical protein